MSVASSAIVGGLIGFAFALAFWKRNEEIDADGNICLRYFGPRYAFPLAVVFWIGVGIVHIDDPMYLRHPENFYVLLVFLILSIVASVHYTFYRIILTEDSIERYQWPLRVRKYSLNELSSISKKRRKSVLNFSNGKSFTIHLLLSGQVKFLERLQAFHTAQTLTNSNRPYSAPSETKK